MTEAKTIRCPHRSPGGVTDEGTLPAEGKQCGLPAGHDGDHTVLIPTGMPWFGGAKRKPTSKEFVFAEPGGHKEKINVEYDPCEPMAVITRSVKHVGEKRFKHVESIAIPTALVPKVCFALGATEWAQ